MLKFEMLPPLDAPHHLRKHEWAPYREGKVWLLPFVIVIGFLLGL